MIYQKHLPDSDHLACFQATGERNLSIRAPLDGGAQEEWQRNPVSESKNTIRKSISEVLCRR